MKQVQHSHFFFVLGGSTKPKTPSEITGIMRLSCWLSAFFVNQVFFIRLCARSHKRGCFLSHLTLLLHKMDLSHATYFTQEEQVVIMEN